MVLESPLDSWPDFTLFPEKIPEFRKSDKTILKMFLKKIVKSTQRLALPSFTSSPHSRSIILNFLLHCSSRYFRIVYNFEKSVLFCHFREVDIFEKSTISSSQQFWIVNIFEKSTISWSQHFRIVNILEKFFSWSR